MGGKVICFKDTGNYREALDRASRLLNTTRSQIIKEALTEYLAKLGIRVVDHPFVKPGRPMMEVDLEGGE